MKKALIVLLALVFTVAGAGIGVACETGGMWRLMDEAPMNPDVADNPVMTMDGHMYMYMCKLDTVEVLADSALPVESSVVLEDGKIYTGLLAAETATSVTLRAAPAVTTTSDVYSATVRVAF